MAKVILENVTVDRVFSTRNGFGVGVSETFNTRSGETGRKRYTLWFTEHPGVEEGQRVSASGFLGVKAREYESRDGEMKTTVDVSVNSARLIQSAPPVDPAPPVDTWGQEPAGASWGSQNSPDEAWSTPTGSDAQNDAWGGDF